MTTVASRVLKRLDGTVVEVGLTLPVEVSSGEWKCEFRIGDDVHEAFGLDGVQALLMALKGLRFYLARLAPSTWEGGEPGDVGIPRFVPQAFGLAFSQHMDAVIESELAEFVAHGKKPAP